MREEKVIDIAIVSLSELWPLDAFLVNIGYLNIGTLPTPRTQAPGAWLG